MTKEINHNKSVSLPSSPIIDIYCSLFYHLQILPPVITGTEELQQ